jgi:hypothetical protein
MVSLELDAIVTTMGATGFGPDNTETGSFLNNQYLISCTFSLVLQSILQAGGDNLRDEMKSLRAKLESVNGLDTTVAGTCVHTCAYDLPAKCKCTD